MENSFYGSLFFILLIVLVLLTVFGIIYIYVTSKNKERLALIEKGMDPNLANSDFWLQVGIIAGGAALGLIVAGIIGSTYGPLVAILFSGTGLVIYNLVRKSKAKNK
jgi:predicted MFS family arabinose efflux permease